MRLTASSFLAFCAASEGAESSLVTSSHAIVARRSGRTPPVCRADAGARRFESRKMS